MDDVPVGLKNVGNTCYFNSFMQAFFFLPNLQSKFTLANVKKLAQIQRTDSKGDPVVENRRLASIELVSQLQKLFVAMLYTNQRYVDPKPVLASVVDDDGKLVKVGQEKDSTEYLLNLIERIEEGLAEEPPETSIRVAESMLIQKREIQKPVETKKAAAPDWKFDDEDDESTEARSLTTQQNFLMEESYFQHSKPTEDEPIRPKETYTNSIYENFFGQNTTITKLFNKETHEERFISKNSQKMGPVILNLKNGRLFDDWEDVCRTEIAGFAKAGPNEVCVSENWIKDPPNILYF